MKEIWRKVEGFENYMISNNNGWKRICKNKESFPNGRVNNGYRMVSLGKVNGKPIAQLYHILVAKAFPEICGEWFEGCVVHHKDFNRLNNVPENLVILTQSEHHKLHYQYLDERFTKPSPLRNKNISKALKGKKKPERCNTYIQKKLDGTFVREYSSLEEIISVNHFSSMGNISSACSGKLQTAYGFIWERKKAV